MVAETTEDLLIRRATRADAPRLSDLFQLTYPNSSHPFQNQRDVETFLDDPRNVEIVGELHGRVIAVDTMTHNAWNDSYEIGRTLTDPDFRKHGFAALLVQRTVREVCDCGWGQVFFGFPRVRRIVELCEVLYPPFLVVGHDGGRNVANGRRETHLIVYAVPAHARFTHAAPPEAVSRSPFVRDEIYGRLGLTATPHPYPEVAFVGAPTPGCIQIGDFTIAYDPVSAHRSMDVLAYGSPPTDPREISRELDDLFQKYSDARHVTATVLADKVELIRVLREYGFDVVAYRPAWYPHGEARFDCVELAKRAYPERALVQGFDDVLRSLVAGLASVVPAEGPETAARGSRVTRPPSSEFRQTSRSTIVPPPLPASSTWRPLLFRLGSQTDRLGLAECLARDGAFVRVHDTLHLQLRDLLKTRHPSVKLSTDELGVLVDRYLGPVPPEEYGVWVYYPWSGKLVHLLDRPEFVELRTNRNRNKITAAEQAVLATKRIGVVGLSVGQSVALALALERSCGELRLADFDTLDLSNLNRLRATVHDLGVPKVYVTARQIAELDPYLDVNIYSDGVTAENIELFLFHGGRLDIIVEECDSIDIKVLIREQARHHGIPVVMDTSDRGMLDIERFDLEPGRPIFHGLAPGLSAAALRGLTTEQKLPFVLRITDVNTLSDRLRASMVEIEQTITTWPQLGADVVHGGAAAALACRRIGLGQLSESGRYLLDLDDFGVNHLARQSEPIASPTATAMPVPAREPVTDPQVRSLVSQAILAPSGGNTQPWLWRATNEALHLFLDPARTAGLIDVEAAGSYAALGCAAENLVLAAHAAGLSVRVQTQPDPQRPDLAATFVITSNRDKAAEPHVCDELHAQLAVRHTNRRLGPRTPLSPRDRETLTAAVRSIAGAEVEWLTSDTELASIGELVGAADRLRMLHPQCHREMYRELRWTADEAMATRDGIDVATLELDASDMAGLELCRHWSSLDLVRQWGGGRNLEKMSRKWVEAASAVGLITMPAARSLDYFNGGRALQRMWLTATAHGIAVHPMTTLPYFFALVSRAGSQGLDDRAIAELQSMRASYERLFIVGSATGEVLLFRVSKAQATDKRSLRRQVDDVLEKFIPG
jgi:molybdopterin/thiamine biosynthesis adenylyltransferase/nitroreductase/GNAT superfamily N-acetyltransferase